MCGVLCVFGGGEVVDVDSKSKGKSAEEAAADATEFAHNPRQHKLYF